MDEGQGGAGAAGGGEAGPAGGEMGAGNFGVLLTLTECFRV